MSDGPAPTGASTGEDRGLRVEYGAKPASTGEDRGLRVEYGAKPASTGEDRGLRVEYGAKPASTGEDRGLRVEYGAKPASTGEDRGLRVEYGAKRVRAYLGGRLVADTTAPLLVWEAPYFPTYYVPAAHVRAELAPTGETRRSPSRGEGEVLDVRVDGTVAASGALRYPASPMEALRDAVRLEWDAMDQWLEEDEPVYVHARSPYTRVDALASSRHVEVRIGGETVADSVRPHILFETGLPPRYYLPLSDVRQELLRPSATSTSCPYKGTAAYWSVEVGDQLHEDVVWTYRTPLPESQKIAGLACFYNEKVDLVIDGVPEARPHTQFP